MGLPVSLRSLVEWRGSLGSKCINFQKSIITIIHIIILPVVLYGYETWYVILREDCKIRAFGNRILRRIFGSKRDENG